MLILFNFNSYLGGGETLLVRYAVYLYRRQIPFHVYCKENGFISRQLQKEGVPQSYYSCIGNRTDYPYLNRMERSRLLDEIDRNLQDSDAYNYVSFCLRELYMLMDLNKRHPGTISHLILHNQDHHFLGRTIWDGIMEKSTRRKNFHNRRNLLFNQQILRRINLHDGLISMSWIITQLWKRDLGLTIPEERIVPLPSFHEKKLPLQRQNNKRIIWVGRLVDFKIASLFAMLNYIKRNPAYHLTIAGDGDRQSVSAYIKQHRIPVDNIHFAGEVSYSDLPEMISRHAIGYAMGTSILECIQEGIPVIMALANNANALFERDVCGGLFYNTTKGNIGEDLCIYRENDIPTTIDDAIQEIESDYPLAASRCYEYAKREYSNESNFSAYTRLITATKPIDTQDTVVPVSSRLRRYLFSKCNE